MEANHVLHWPTGARRFRSGLSKAVRLAASAGLLALLIAPAATAPETALADNNLNWEGIRPPSTRASSTNLPYTSLDRFGTSADLAMGTIPPQHELVIAPNGDIFTSGKSSAGAAAPPVFKSTDGGKSWNQSVALTPGTVITGLAVSPKYPGDNVVFASYSDGAAGVNNGVALSTDGGSTFTTVADFGAGASNALSLANGNRNGAATPVLPVNGGTPFNVTALSVSPNFDNSTGAGAVVLAGGGPDGTDIAYQLAIASGGAVNTASGNTRPLRFTGGSFASGTVNSIAVAFSPDFSNDGVIGLLYSCTGAVDGANTRCPALGTYVSRFSAGAFTMPNTTSDNLGVTGGGGFVATTGGLAFPTDYRDVTGGGTYYAATGNGAVVGSGDVYKRTGGFWNGMGRSADFGSMAISGMSSNVNILAAVDSTGMGGSGINLVHRSTSAGDSFTTTQALDGEKYLLNVTGGANAVAMTSDYATTGVAYATLPGTLGGVVKSTNRGSNWVDTGLTNEAFTTVQAIFFAATAPGGFAKMTDGVNSALFWTDNVSTTSTWVRVHRSLGSLTYIVPPDYSTARTLYAFSSTVTSAMIIKSTNSGRSWDTISSDPSSDGRIMTMEAVSAARLMVGDDRGRVWNSSDGGGSWTQATGTLGQRITSIRMLPDFGTMNTVAVGAIAGGAPEVFLSEDGGVTFKQVGSNLAAWGATSNSTMGLTIRNDSEYHANKMLYVRCDTCSDTDVWRIAVGKETSFTRLGVPSNIRPVGLHTFIGSAIRAQAQPLALMRIR
ncbi:MAG: hypothetical protein NTZ05_04950 [Chloroflexi bacterium]|nr:hypothetical protein [Chloroflexota bacterium]